MLKLYDLYSRREVQELFDPDYDFQPSRGTWGLQGVIRLPNKANDWVFFVSYGQSQGGHEFDEGITPDGVLTWQSQPSQSLIEKRIQQWIDQNPTTDMIYLFLRPNKKSDYYYLGNLNYLNHDPDREKPVWFQFQISDFTPSKEIYELIKGGEVTTEYLPKLTEPTVPQKYDPPSKSEVKTTTRTFKAQKFPDLSGREAADKELGLQGELFVLKLEIKRLSDVGRSDLASKVEHTSLVRGDGAGYDIKSFNDDGTVKYLEVKTTKGGLKSGFYLTPNELAFARYNPETYVLVRVFGFNLATKQGDYFELDGDPENHVNLIPVNYRASF